MMPNMAMTLGEGEPAAGPWQVVPLAQLVRMLRPRNGAPAGRPRVLAVDGRSGSGKTTVAERIRGAVPASRVVHTDDVFWSQAMFDWTDLLIGGLLEPVHRGEPVSYWPPARGERNRSGAIEVPQGRELLIVEGAGVARHELMDLVDAVVWVSPTWPKQSGGALNATAAMRRLSRSGTCGWRRSCRSWPDSDRGHGRALSRRARQAFLTIRRMKWSSPELTVGRRLRSVPVSRQPR